MPGPRPINIQDSFLFQSLKEDRELAVCLTTGKAFKGVVKRFDRFAVIFETSGQELLIYKHGIISIGDVPGAAARTNRPTAPPARRTLGGPRRAATTWAR